MPARPSFDVSRRPDLKAVSYRVRLREEVQQADVIHPRNHGEQRRRWRASQPACALVCSPPLPPPIDPALMKHAEERAKDVQNRVADRITSFSGSMTFVYIHILWFGLWIGLGVEEYPFGLLTMIVSLEAIFLSTFVMISQNRADAKRQVIADEQWKTVQIEDQQNEELLKLSKQILQLTQEVRSFADRFDGDTRHH